MFNRNHILIALMFCLPEAYAMKRSGDDLDGNPHKRIELIPASGLVAFSFSANERPINVSEDDHEFLKPNFDDELAWRQFALEDEQAWMKFHPTDPWQDVPNDIVLYVFSFLSLEDLYVSLVDKRWLELSRRSFVNFYAFHDKFNAMQKSIREMAQSEYVRQSTMEKLRDVEDELNIEYRYKRFIALNFFEKQKKKAAAFKKEHGDIKNHLFGKRFYMPFALIRIWQPYLPAGLDELDEWQHPTFFIIGTTQQLKELFILSQSRACHYANDLSERKQLRQIALELSARYDTDFIVEQNARHIEARHPDIALLLWSAVLKDNTLPPLEGYRVAALFGEDKQWAIAAKIYCDSLKGEGGKDRLTVDIARRGAEANYFAGDFESASKWFDGWLQMLGPAAKPDQETIQRIGDAKFRAKKFDVAVSWYKKLASLTPQEKVNMGESFWEMNDKKHAVELFTEALKEEPSVRLPFEGEWHFFETFDEKELLKFQAYLAVNDDDTPIQLLLGSGMIGEDF